VIEPLIYEVIKEVYFPLLVSPTGFDGFCRPNIGWGIPFQGAVNAA
jgi:hypothetical protein